MTGKKNKEELLWFQIEETLNFITAAPRCGRCKYLGVKVFENSKLLIKIKMKISCLSGPENHVRS
jgi:hypothetical protein